MPAHVVVYYVIALALYGRSSYREALRCWLEGVQWLVDPSIAGGSVMVSQGGPFSPLAANIYRNGLDWFLDAIRRKTAEGGQLSPVRR